MELKNRILLTFKYLWEHTDEAHTVSLEQLKDHLQSCGLSRPDSRTIKADIDQLIELGVDIIIDRRVQNQYFIGTRHFDTAEVKLLIDAVQSSRFITPQKSKALIRKLGVFIEPQQKQLLKRQLYIDHRSKRRLRERVGKLTDEQMAEIDAALRISLYLGKDDYLPTEVEAP